MTRSPTTSKLLSPVRSQDEASCSQDTESTISLTSPSQDIETPDKGEDQINIKSASVECQTDNCIFLSNEEYDQLISKTVENPDINSELQKLKIFFLAYDSQPPVMDPERLEGICKQVGATKLFSSLYSDYEFKPSIRQCESLTKLRVMVVIYNNVLPVTPG